MFPGTHSNLAGQNAPINPSAHQIYNNTLQPSLPPQQNFTKPNSFGFGQAPAQQNVTGYVQNQLTSFQSPPMPLRMQPTGFPTQQISSFNNGQTQQQIYQNTTTNLPQMPQMPQQFQNLSHSMQHPEAPTQLPQPTGFTAMADSFKTATLTSQARGRRAAKNQMSVKIPNIRLSFITAQDQAKFEALFKSAVGNGQTLSGEKARDLLLTSKLDGNSLSQIWTLADTTKSGQLHFPEFALAMYLCNVKLVGKPLPLVLSSSIKNEVSSMVDIINFGVADDGSEPIYNTNTNTPQFLGPQSNLSPPTINQPQINNMDLNSYSMRAPGLHEQQQQINFQQPTQNGYSQVKQTLHQNQNANQNAYGTTAGYSGTLSPIPQMPTGFGQNQRLPSTQTGLAGTISPLDSQPTGIQSQWGLVNAPVTGLPNIDLLQSRMMPKQGREQGGFTTSGLKGNAVIPWAVTKEEKKRYDSVFKAWDGFGKGYIGGDVAIEVFGQSGLEKSDLERIWTLADHGNKGRLNMDEFSVAMHLIYRKLNGYPLPLQLPPELVPPSTRNFTDSIGAVKSLLHQESDLRKNSGATLLPQKTGVSYLKSHSFRTQPILSNNGKKDATVFKNNDDDIGYKSSARHRSGIKPSQSSSSSINTFDDSSIEELKKRVHEKQLILDTLDQEAKKIAKADDELGRKDRDDAEDLYRRIRRTQEDIDAHPDSALCNTDSASERRALKCQLQALTDKLPEIASQVRTTEQNIANAKLELFRLRDAKAYPESASFIVGTGPGGVVTESDRLKARAKAIMQQRSAALTGKKIEIKSDNLQAEKRLEEEELRIRSEKENNENMVKDVEESVHEFSRSLYDSLDGSSQDSSSDHERKRWEEGLGVQDELKDFIFELQRFSRLARINKTGSIKATDQSLSNPMPRNEMSPSEPKFTQSYMKPTPSQTSSVNSSYKSPEDRAAYIKQQAEQRMAERLAALGIRAPKKSGESTQDRLEREKNERAAKIRQAEEDDARREAEHLSKMNENIEVPLESKNTDLKLTLKVPPPPPSRKALKNDLPKQKTNDKSVIYEQKAQRNYINESENDIASQEAELLKQRSASESRLKALEEQVKAGKLKKEEEKRRRKAAAAEAKEKEYRLAARRAEIEAAREREYELQKQLESINNDDSSDSETPGPSILETPKTQSPTKSEKQTLPPSIPENLPVPSNSTADGPVPVEPAPSSYVCVTPGPLKTPMVFETNNPFLTKSPKTDNDESHQIQSNNPFHHLPSYENKTQVISQPSSNRNRVRPEDDEWSVVDSDVEDDSSDDGGPGAGNARQLASILFGTMEPPRPVSAASGMASSSSVAIPRDEPVDQSSFTDPVSSNQIETGQLPPSIALDSQVIPVPAPPPPPPPNFGTPPPPPPVPNAGPSLPGSGPPPPPPLPAMDGSIKSVRPAGLLGEIQLGKALKKTQTKDKSGAAVAGRVLN